MHLNSPPVPPKKHSHSVPLLTPELLCLAYPRTWRSSQVRNSPWTPPYQTSSQRVPNHLFDSGIEQRRVRCPRWCSITLLPPRRTTFRELGSPNDYHTFSVVY